MFPDTNPKQLKEHDKNKDYNLFLYDDCVCECMYTLYTKIYK